MSATCSIGFGLLTDTLDLGAAFVSELSSCAGLHAFGGRRDAEAGAEAGDGAHDAIEVLVCRTDRE